MSTLLKKTVRLRSLRKWSAGALACALTIAAAGCSADQLVGRAKLPNDVVDPAKAKTRYGAVGAYNSALSQFRIAVGGGGRNYVVASGLLSDELQSGQLGAARVESNADVDARKTGNDISAKIDEDVYALLQKVRGQASQARGLLTDFYPDASQGALVGHMLAVTGYSEVMLAELFCSGVPLSTLDYNGDYTYQPGSSSVVIFQHAVALFDSAIVLASDSSRIVNFAQIGKGRALLQLGQYAEAAAAVAAVPAGYRYTLSYTANAFNAQSFVTVDMQGQMRASVGNRDGGNGLPFQASGDPRLPPFTTWSVNLYGYPIVVPVYAEEPYFLPLATGIEAQLIRAEAALAANDANWLVLLNALRTDGTFTTAPRPGAPGVTDTSWNAGVGGVAGLAPLNAGDYPSDSARVTLLFTERAYWLFLTGHRQGDLRRLVRQYHRGAETVYPTGAYPGPATAYGTAVALNVPPSEKRINSKYTGCFNRDA